MANDRYPHVLAAVFDRPWAIQPSKLEAIGEMIERRVDGIRLTPEAAEAWIAEAQARSRPIRSSGATAVIPLFGTLLNRVGGLEAMSGASSLKTFSAAFRAALADEAIKSIVIPIDSPGGEAGGTPETAALVYSARGIKPVTAVVDTLAASAAYWIGRAAEEMVSTPSGTIGSVGVYMLHQDVSAAAEAAGVKFTYIEAPLGGFKTEGSSVKPLSEAGAAHAQEMIDHIYGSFVSDLARFTGEKKSTVSGPQFGQGRVFMAPAALERGMIDRIETFEEVLARHGGSAGARMYQAEAASPAPMAELEAGAETPAESPAPRPVSAREFETLLELTRAANYRRNAPEGGDTSDQIETPKEGAQHV